MLVRITNNKGFILQIIKVVFFLLSDPCDSGWWICLLRTIKEEVRDVRRCCRTWEEVHFLPILSCCIHFWKSWHLPLMMRHLDLLMPLNLGLAHIIWNLLTWSITLMRVKKIEEFPRAITRAPKQSKAKQNRPLRCSNSFYKINSFEDLIISFCLFLLFDNQINTFWLSISYIH